MPTYEYRCPQGHEFEKFFRSISAAESSLPCPTCGEIATRQLSAGAGLMFKGSGFYLTDYGKNAHASKGPAKPAAKSDTGGDAKPDSKAEPKPSSDAKAAAEAKPAAPAPKKPSAE